MILIGVVFTGDPRMQQVFRGNYGTAVRRGGGVPVFLPWKPEHAAFWAKHLDGFLFTGGGDPDPRYYGQSMRPECGTPTPARDEFELALLKAVMDTGKPVLGICRGEQILNVALGGTLLSGGKFYIGGSVIGAITIQTLTTTMYAVGVASDHHPVKT